jgi:Asp-tRNA(Asn)/Glu-tRNA(Gln) amidotransferase A subunit family amidase
LDWKKLRIGYLKDDFEKPWNQPTPVPLDGATEEEMKAYERRKANEPATLAAREYDRKFDMASLDVFKKMGVTLIPVEIPKFPYDAMRTIYTTEGAAAFDDLTISGRDKLLYEASQSAWPNAFRAARFYPAVEYIQTMRARTLAIQAFAKVFEKVDIIVTPTSGPSNQVTVTNLTGHPAVIVPNGLRGPDAPVTPAQATVAGPATPGNQAGGPNTMVSLTFLGSLYKDAETCAFAHAYQQATGFHKLHPTLV